MKKRFAFAIILLLLLGAGLSWGWYFTTRKPPQRRAGILIPRKPIPSKPLDWKKASPSERAAATKSILAQLDAFKRDNYALAAKYQSRGLKANFRSPEDFRQMMQSTYPQFARYKKAVFGPARSHSKGQVVEIPITLVGSDGITVQATYTMQLEEGLYRVAGVQGGAMPQSVPRDPDFGDALAA